MSYDWIEVACPECRGITGKTDPRCEFCDGSGRAWEIDAPQDEVDAAVENVMRQIKQIQQPN